MGKPPTVSWVCAVNHGTLWVTSPRGRLSVMGYIVVRRGFWDEGCTARWATSFRALWMHAT